MQINLAIAHLLLRHNCVIIPSFGGFVANVRTAQIDKQKGIIQPPKKVLTFNANLVNNDGLLSNYLANTSDVSFDEANTYVLSTCENWKKELDKGNRIEIEKVGFLYLDEEGNLNFEQNRFFNLLLSSFGLEEVKFIAEEERSIPLPSITKKEEVEHAPTENTSHIEHVNTLAEIKSNLSQQKAVEPTKIVDLNPPRKKRNFWKYAAAAILIPVAFYSFWIPMRTDVLQSGILLSDDFNPFQHSNTELYKQKNINLDIEPLEMVSLQEQLKNLPKDVRLFAYHLDEYKYVQLKVNTDQKNKTVLVSSNKGSEKEAAFQIITGCFSNKNNALHLIEELKNAGFSAYLFDKHKGLYRVSANGVNTMTETNKTKQKLKDFGFDSWVLSR